MMKNETQYRDFWIKVLSTLAFLCLIAVMLAFTAFIVVGLLRMAGLM